MHSSSFPRMCRARTATHLRAACQAASRLPRHGIYNICGPAKPAIHHPTLSPTNADASDSKRNRTPPPRLYIHSKKPAETHPLCATGNATTYNEGSIIGPGLVIYKNSCTIDDELFVLLPHPSTTHPAKGRVRGGGFSGAFCLRFVIARLPVHSPQ